MKNKIIIIAAIYIVTHFQISSFGSNFKDELHTLGLSFSVPNEFNSVTPFENSAMNYEHALQHKTKKYEVRLSLRPIPQKMVAEYNEWLKKKIKDATMVDPNSLFHAEFHATMLNIAGTGATEEPQFFDSSSVKSEFGADAGKYAFIHNMASPFSDKYRNCLMVGLHKKDVGQVYIFHLFDELHEVEDLINTMFYVLKFSCRK